MPKTIQDWVESVHINAVAHGWWDADETPADRVAKLPAELLKIHCELSEAVACLRTESFATTTNPDHDNKPEGFWIEIADCVLGLFAVAGAFHVNLEQLLEQKHAYNRARPYRHGDKKF